MRGLHDRRDASEERDDQMRARKEERNQAIWKAHKEGKMQKEIAEEFGLSRGRVCKIIEYYRKGWWSE